MDERCRWGKAVATADPPRLVPDGGVSGSLASRDPPARPPFVYWVSLWIAASAPAYALFVYDILSTAMGIRIGRDFTNMWTAGRMALGGDGAFAFDVNVFRLELLDRAGILSLQNFSYPPHALFIDAIFALPPYWIGLIAWTAFGAWFFISAARTYLPQGFPPALAALTPAATICIWGGQFGLLIGALWLIVYRDCESRPVRAGLAAAALTIKPHLGLLVAALLVTRRKALITACLATIGVVVASGLVFGAYSWASFFSDTAREQAKVLTTADNEFYFLLMPTIFPSIGGGTVGVLAQAAGAVFALSQMWRIRRMAPVELAFPAATATFLILPYAFNFDMTVVALGFAILLFERWGELSPAEKIILTLGFVSPQLTLILPQVTPAALVAPAALAASLFVQCNHLLKHQIVPLAGLRTDKD